MTTDNSSSNDDDMMMAFCIVNPGDTQGRVVKRPKPQPDGPGFARIRVLRAGICNTDLEILQGYMGFHGILGHEFVGIVDIVDGDDELQEKWAGKRVCGDINVGCADCTICCRALDDKCCMMSRNHCPNRTVLGILNRNGTMAEYLTLPVSNLHVVPDHVSDEEAVFAEPLAAACRLPEQGLIDYSTEKPDKVAILGDGKLGLMIAEVLGRFHTKHVPSAQKPILFGKHQHKLDLVRSSGVETRMVEECRDASAFNGVAADHVHAYDVVVDATGSPAGLTLAAGMCRPMGTLVLKSTCAAGEQFNAAPFVIDELKVVGSRCGPIDKALELLSINKKDKVASVADDPTRSEVPLHVEKYITQTFPLAEAEKAIQCAAERSTMKVQIICSET